MDALFLVNIKFPATTIFCSFWLNNSRMWSGLVRYFLFFFECALRVSMYVEFGEEKRSKKDERRKEEKTSCVSLSPPGLLKSYKGVFPGHKTFLVDITIWEML